MGGLKFEEVIAHDRKKQYQPKRRQELVTGVCLERDDMSALSKALFMG